jgi:hypothetical protein
MILAVYIQKVRVRTEKISRRFDTYLHIYYICVYFIKYIKDIILKNNNGKKHNNLKKVILFIKKIH